MKRGRGEWGVKKEDGLRKGQRGGLGGERQGWVAGERRLDGTHWLGVAAWTGLHQEGGEEWVGVGDGRLGGRWGAELSCPEGRG